MRKYWQITCPLAVIAILFCWIVHSLQLGSANGREWFYTFIALLGVLYYVSQEIPVTDVPIVICMFIIILSAQQDMKLIYLVQCSYPVLLLWHIFVTGYLGVDTEQLIWVRIILGLVCLMCSLFISRFFIKQHERELLSRDRIEKELNNAKKDSKCGKASVWSGQ